MVFQIMQAPEPQAQKEVARGRAPSGLWTWVWAILLTILVVPPFYSFHSIAVAFAEIYASFSPDLPSFTKLVIASSASIASDLRIALAIHISLLIVLAITAAVRKAFFGVAICNLVILLTLVVALYAPIFVIGK